MSETSDPGGPRTPGSVLGPVRFLFHWAIKIIILVALGISAALRPRLVRYGLVVLLVAGVVGWRLFGGAIPGLNAQTMQAGVASSMVSNLSPNNQLPSSPVVERFIQAEASFNAAGMYSLFSDSMKSVLPGTSDQDNLQQIQSALDTAKSAGRHYTDVIYMGGMPIENGESVYFYVVKVQTGSDTASVPYIYVVGPDNKIDSIQ